MNRIENGRIYFQISTIIINHLETNPCIYVYIQYFNQETRNDTEFQAQVFLEKQEWGGDVAREYWSFNRELGAIVF